MFNIINTIILILINIINKFEKKILLLLKKTMLFVKFEKKTSYPSNLDPTGAPNPSKLLGLVGR
jgi:hypothetical protein